MTDVELTAATGRVHRGVWREAEGEARGAAVILPGVRYTPAHPLLHFATKVLRAAGMDVLEAWFDHRDVEGSAASFEAFAERSATDAEAAVAELDARGAAGRRFLVGKSLGSLQLALLGLRGALADVPTAWLTPLLTREPVPQALAQRTAPTLLVVGTADPATPPEAIEETRRTCSESVEIVEIAGADHALELPDPHASVAALGQTVRALDDIVARTR